MDRDRDYRDGYGGGGSGAYDGGHRRMVGRSKLWPLPLEALQPSTATEARLPNTTLLTFLRACN